MTKRAFKLMLAPVPEGLLSLVVQNGSATHLKSSSPMNSPDSANCSMDLLFCLGSGLRCLKRHSDHHASMRVFRLPTRFRLVMSIVASLVKLIGKMISILLFLSNHTIDRGYIKKRVRNPTTRPLPVHRPMIAWLQVHGTSNYEIYTMGKAVVKFPTYIRTLEASEDQHKNRALASDIVAWQGDDSRGVYHYVARQPMKWKAGDHRRSKMTYIEDPSDEEWWLHYINCVLEEVVLVQEEEGGNIPSQVFENFLKLLPICVEST